MAWQKQPEIAFSGCFISYSDKCYPFYPIYPNLNRNYTGNTLTDKPSRLGIYARQIPFNKSRASMSDYIGDPP
ncbi:hypothetical protein GCWU000324_02544 [Kingella oralis ATCC 51147]|uniref:Uncharacterized protein n=1 Tax=Kingella oralis ATCC 51147 TaxID=629741 RepID=C4GLH3_9NEIS|nr:hypothetical protein GCWU000324_02544 [Kingella oralis ATCC 51147]